MIRNTINDAMALDALIETLISIRQREGNLPVTCYGGGGSDYWLTGVRLAPADADGPARLVMDEVPWPEEVQHSPELGKALPRISPR